MRVARDNKRSAGAFHREPAAVASRPAGGMINAYARRAIR